MSKKSKVLSNSVLYSFNSILLKAINFCFIPIYTTYLSTADYGTTNLVTSFNSVATYIISFSLYSAVVRFYVDYKDNREELKRFYGTLILFICCSGPAFMAIFLIFKDFISKFFFDGVSFYPTVFIALSGLTFGCLHTLYQSILQGRQEGKKFTITSVCYFTLTVTLNMIFVVGLKLGANGVLLATLVTNGLFTVYVFFDLIRSKMITLCIDIKILRESLKYSIPIMPHNLSTSIATLASRVVINKSHTLSAVGLFGLASQFGNVADAVQSSVNMAFSPWFYEKMNQNTPESRKDVLKMVDPLLWIYGIVFLTISLFSQEAIYFMAEESYSAAWKVVPLLAVACSIKTVYNFYSNILFYYKRAAKLVFIASLSGSFVNIFVSIILIPKYGAYGAGIAEIISKLVISTIVVFMSRLFDDVGFNLFKMVGMVFLNTFFIAGGLYFSYSHFADEFSFINLMYKLCVVALYVGIAAFSMRKEIGKYFNQILKIVRNKKLK